MQMKQIFICSLLISIHVSAQNRIDSFRIFSDVKITIDAPVHFNYKKSINFYSEHVACGKLSDEKIYTTQKEYVKYLKISKVV